MQALVKSLEGFGDWGGVLLGGCSFSGVVVVVAAAVVALGTGWLFNMAAWVEDMVFVNFCTSPTPSTVFFALRSRHRRRCSSPRSNALDAQGTGYLGVGPACCILVLSHPSDILQVAETCLSTFVSNL